MSDITTVIEKLKKILAGTEGGRGCTEAEMNVRMAKAQKLAMEHNIDLGTINTSSTDTGAPAIETDVQAVGSKHSTQERPHHHPIRYLLKECFQIEYVRWDATTVKIVGEKVDVALACYVFEWLDAQFPRLHRAYCNALGISHTPADTTVRRKSYYWGLANGIIAVNKRTRSEMSSSDQSKYALVLVNKEQIVKNRLYDEFPWMKPTPRDPNAPAPKVRKARATQWHDGAYSAGDEKGRSIKLGHGLEQGKERLS